MSHWSKPLAVILLLLSLASALSFYTIRSMSPLDAKADIIVGVTPGPHADIMYVVKQVAEQSNFKVQVRVYSDYSKLNMALAKGEIDLNSFQHQPYLEHSLTNQKLDIEPIGKSFFFPIGLYSAKYKTLEDIPPGATIYIPSDLQNTSRALLLLDKLKLLQLKNSEKAKVLLNDIVKNPKELQIHTLDGENLPKLLSQADLIVMNANFAMEAGLSPSKNALALEDTTSLYVNVFAIRTADKVNPKLKQFLALYQSAPVRQFIQEHYQGAMLPGW